MDETWWVRQDQLDDHQRDIWALPVENSYKVLGPPGSGKTNLLLLRANHLFLSERKDIAIVTFTRSLRDFIATGGKKYDFPMNRVYTSRAWALSFLARQNVEVALPEGFQAQREYLSQIVSETIESQGLSNIYDAILVDEAQDYTERELKAFAALATVLFCVCDARQQIFQKKDGLSAIEDRFDETRTLQFHYRNGMKICRVAEHVLLGAKHGQFMSSTSNYDEDRNESSVEAFRCESFREQVEKALERVRIQLKAFPYERIGIACPRREQLDELLSIVAATELADTCVVLRGLNRGRLEPDKRLVLLTCHSSKGLEFRAFHMVGCERFEGMPRPRNLVFTSVTRAKTSLSVYYSDELLGFFDSALASIIPPRRPPSLDDCFKGRS